MRCIVEYKQGQIIAARPSNALFMPPVWPHQATQQLGPAWTLMRVGTTGCPEIPDWLAENLPDDARIGIDPLLHTVRSLHAIQGSQVLYRVLCILHTMRSPSVWHLEPLP